MKLETGGPDEIVNTENLKLELKWLRDTLTAQQTGDSLPEPPELKAESAYHALIKKYKLTSPERLLIMLALAPTLTPGELEGILLRDKEGKYIWRQSFGGTVQSESHIYQPNLQTAAFLLCGESLIGRKRLEDLIQAGHTLRRRGLLHIPDEKQNQSAHLRPLLPGPLLLDAVLSGIQRPAEFSPNFPAKLLETSLTWDDLVLNESVMEKVQDLLLYLEHNEAVRSKWSMKTRVNPGFRGLFYGTPGTGKTLTVALLGQACARPVYRIDLSRLVSKYIGETEKNLEAVFERAEEQDWILFFDEADALFAKRTGVSSSNDRYANQETAYLLQKMEVCENPVLMATNSLFNMDPAFRRRFQSIIEFPNPQAPERLRLWRECFGEIAIFSDDVDLETVADKWAVTGGLIVNAVHYISLKAASESRTLITQDHILQGLRRELQQHGRSL